MAKDPVCGMEVQEQKAAATSTYHGHVYYFCSARCKERFEQHPEQYQARQPARQ